MQATKILMDEHRLIEQVLDCLEQLAERCTADGKLEERHARDAVSFLRTFADRAHHGKEEAELFPLMETRGFRPDAGPTAVMRVEHTEGRRLVDGIEQAIEGAARGEREAVESFSRDARSFVWLLRSHIEKEDQVLFPMADQALTDEDRETLSQRFARVDDQEIGRDVLEQCRRTADALADSLGVPLRGDRP